MLSPNAVYRPSIGHRSARITATETGVIVRCMSASSAITVLLVAAELPSWQSFAPPFQSAKRLHIGQDGRIDQVLEGHRNVVGQVLHPFERCSMRRIDGSPAHSDLGECGLIGDVGPVAVAVAWSSTRSEDRRLLPSLSAMSVALARFAVCARSRAISAALRAPTVAVGTFSMAAKPQLHWRASTHPGTWPPHRKRRRRSTGGTIPVTTGSSSIIPVTGSVVRHAGHRCTTATAAAARREPEREYGREAQRDQVFLCRHLQGSP